MNSEQILRIFLQEMLSHELWVADVGATARSLDERVTRLVLSVMKSTEAIVIAENEEDNLLAAVQMAGLGAVDETVLDSGPAQRIYSLACDITEAISEQRRHVLETRTT